MNEAQQSSEIQYGAPEKGRGLAIRNTYSSLVAGVGSAVTSQPELAKPKLADLTSDEAFEKFQAYNTNTNLRVNERRMWGQTAEKVAGYLLTGAALAIGQAALTSLTAASVPLWVSGGLAIGAMVGVTVGVFHIFQQPATKEQSDKFMDVSDYNIKRQAGVLAQEIKKALTEDGVDLGKSSTSSHTREVIVVEQPANEDKAPSTVLSAQAAERALQESVVAQSTQTERA
jgi:hypothetical protein